MSKSTPTKMNSTNPSNSTASPMKGIDRISEELRQERQKVNQFQQERSKQKIEIETLKQSIESYKIENEEIQNQYYHLKKQSQEQTVLIESLQSEIQFYQQTLKQNDSEKKELETFLQQFEQETNQLNELITKQKEENLTLQFRLETIEKKQSTKDELINSLKKELLTIRQSQLTIEKDNLDHLHHFNDSQNLQEELTSTKELIEEYEKTIQQTKENNDQLLNELNQSLALNTTYQKQVEELNTRLMEVHSKEKQLLSTVDQLMNDRDLSTKDTAQYEETTSQLQQTLQLERESNQSLRQRNDSLVEKNHFLEKQLHEVKDLYEKTLQSNLLLEENYHQAKVLNLKYQEEIMSDREKLQELELQLQQSASSVMMKQEIESLRNQLQSMRKRVIQQDLEQETGVFQSQQVMDREHQGRQVYETIIHDLRAEIDKMNHKYSELLQKHNELHMKAARVDQLEEEVIMYKEMAKHITVEKQTVALNASDAVERNLKTAHENHHLLTTVHRLENEIQNYQAEIQTNHNEMSNLREKMKHFHHHQLIAERKATELLSTNNKLQGQYEDLKQDYEILSLDFEKTKRLQTDYLTQIHHLQTTQSLQEKSQQEYDLLQQKYQQSQLLLTQKETQHRKEIELLRSQKEMITQELENAQKTIPIKERTIQETTSQLKEVRELYEELSRQKDALQQELMMIDNKKNEQTLQQLKQEMQDTLAEFEEIEKEKQIKQQIITSLTTNLEKEKEKNVLLTMQMNLLEEKVKVLTQELAVYHGLDVYHSTKQQELEHYRQTSPLLKNKSSITSQGIVPTASGESDYSNPEDAHLSKHHRRIQKLFEENPVASRRTAAKQRKEREVSERKETRSSSPKRRSTREADIDEEEEEEESIATVEGKGGKLSIEDIAHNQAAEKEEKRRQEKKSPQYDGEERKSTITPFKPPLLEDNDDFITTPPPPSLSMQTLREDAESIPTYSQQEEDDDEYENERTAEEEYKRYRPSASIQPSHNRRDESNLLKQSFNNNKNKPYSAPKYQGRDIYSSSSRESNRPADYGSRQPFISSKSYYFSDYSTSERDHSPEQVRRQKKPSLSPSRKYGHGESQNLPKQTTFSSSDSTDALSAQQRAKRKEMREKVLMEKILLEEKSQQLQAQREEQQRNRNKFPKSTGLGSASGEKSPQKRAPYHPHAFDDDPNEGTSRTDVRLGSRSYRPLHAHDPNYVSEILARGRTGVDPRSVPAQMNTTIHLMNNRWDLERARRILNSSNH